MAIWYSNPDHRLLPFNATVEAKDIGEWIPKAPILPIKVGLSITKKPTTPWELLEILEEFEMDKDPKVAEMLNPLKKWVVVAATKGHDDDSVMTIPLLPITIPTKQLKDYLQRHLDCTLGEQR
mmetsp:Transcript_456/g.998  ORF Transcript_456/g.998 Transcript_456/m.998 type:complete len:123 (+) Transcript_456:93-461(+)